MEGGGGGVPHEPSFVTQTVIWKNIADCRRQPQTAWVTSLLLLDLDLFCIPFAFSFGVVSFLVVVFLLLNRKLRT